MVLLFVIIKSKTEANWSLTQPVGDHHRLAEFTDQNRSEAPV